LSPILLRTKFDEALENIEDKVKFGGHLVNAVRFADDQAMVAIIKAGLERIMDVVKKTTEQY